MVPTPLEHARQLLLDPHRCPACGTRLASPRCPGCGLDLAGDAGARVWEASRAAAQALAHHAEVLTSVRSGQRPAFGPPASAGPLARPASSSDVLSRPAPALPGAAVPPPPASGVPGAPHPAGPHVPGPWRPVEPRPVRPPWRVQTVLVTLGAALLGLASLVFLVFTWELLTLPVRAGLVVVGTAAVLALAVLLRRRGLVQSAEAVAALGSALLTLDVWALWATGVFASAPGWLVGGMGLLLCGALLALYGLRTGLRAGSTAAAVLVPAAPLPLAAAVEHAWLTVTALLLSLGLATLRHLPAVRTRVAERRVLAAFAGAAATVAALVLVVELTRTAPRHTVALAVLGAVLVAALAAQSLLARGPAARVWAAASGLLAALLTAITVPPLADSFAPWSAPAAVLLATAVVLAASPARPVTVPRERGGQATTAALVAAGTAAFLAVPEVAVFTAEGILAVLVPDGTPGAAAGPAAATTVASIVLATALGLRLAPSMRQVAVALTCASTLAGVAILARSVPSTTLALTALALVAVGAPLRAPWRTHTRALAVAAAAAAVVAGLDGGASGAPTTWALALVAALVTATLVTLVVARGGRWRAPAAGLAVVPLTFALATTARIVGASPADAACLAAALVGTGVVVLVLLRAGERAERFTALAVAACVQAVTWLVTLVEAGAEPGTQPAVALLPLAAAAQALGLAALGRHRVGMRVRQPAAAVVAPLLALALATTRAVTGQPALSAVLVGAAVLGCATVLVARAMPGFRELLEVSGAGVAAVALAAALVDAPSGVVTLQLALAAVTAGVVGLAPDRRAVGWWALGFAVLASWSGLAVRDVGTPEAYTAPLGLVLGVIGVRRVRRDARTTSEAPGGAPPGLQSTGLQSTGLQSTGLQSTGLPLLAAGVLLVGLPPSLVDDPAVLGSAGSALVLDRTVLLTVAVVGLALGALRLAGSTRPATAGAGRVLAACAAVLAVAGPLRRAVVALLDEPPTAVEAWSFPAALVLGLATLAARRSGGPRPVVLVGAWCTVLAAAVPTVATAAAQLGDDTATGVLRLVAVGLAGTALALVGVRRGALAVTAPGLTALALAGATGALAGGPLPPDAVLAVTGAAAGVVGTAWLVRTPTAGSWPTLGTPGLLVLAPALVGLQVDPDPWRWVVVLIGGTAAVLLGAVRRWQSPFVVGAVVLAAEVLLQLGAAAASVVANIGWWPLLFVGGAVLTVVGVTYEKRLRDAREATRFVSRMR